MNLFFQKLHRLARSNSSQNRIRVLALLLIFSGAFSSIIAGSQTGRQAGNRGRVSAPDPLVPTNHPDIILREAYRASLEGRFVDAIKLFEQYLARGGPESAYVRSQYARALSLGGLHDAARTQSKRALELEPNNPEHLIIYTESLGRAGKHREAAALLKDGIKKYDNAPEIELSLAEAYYRQKLLKEAIVHYKQVLFQLGRAGFRAPMYRNIALWRLGGIYHSRRNMDQARFYYVRFLKHNPSSYFARYILGFIYYRQGNFSRASREFEQILTGDRAALIREKVDLNHVHGALGEIYYLYENHRSIRHLKRVKPEKRSYLDRALILQLEGDDKEALRYLGAFLKSANQRSPDYFIGQIALIRMVEKIDAPHLLIKELYDASKLAGVNRQHRIGITLARRAMAIKEKQPALKISRSHISRQIASHYNALKQPHRTIYYLRTALQEGDQEKVWDQEARRFEILLQLALLMGQKKVGRYQEALALCGDVLKKNAKYARAYYVRGHVNLRNRKPKQAVKEFDKAIELAPNSVLSYFFRAVAYNETGDFAATERDLKKVLSLNEGFPDANNFLGYLYAERNVNLEESRRLIQKAVDQAPVNGAFQDSLGWVYYRMKQWKKARYHLQLAALLLEESEEPDPVVYDHLGDVYLKLKLPAKALVAYNRAFFLLKKLIAKSANVPDVRLTKEQRENRLLLVKIRVKIQELNSGGKSANPGAKK